MAVTAGRCQFRTARGVPPLSYQAPNRMLGKVESEAKITA